MTIKKNIAISDSGFVFDPATGNSFTTNTVGLEVIKFLKEGKALREIENHFLTEYDSDPATIQRDLNDFVNVLLRMKLAET
jgi:hypothetical protein